MDVSVEKIFNIFYFDMPPPTEWNKILQKFIIHLPCFAIKWLTRSLLLNKISGFSF